MTVIAIDVGGVVIGRNELTIMKVVVELLVVIIILVLVIVLEVGAVVVFKAKLPALLNSVNPRH